VQFRISANVTDFKRAALAAKLGITADIPRFDEATLRDDRRFAFDVACCHRTACRAENDIPVDITDVDISGHRDEVQMYRPRHGDLPWNSSSSLIRPIAYKLNDILTAGFLNLNDITFDLYFGSVTAGRIDLKISDGGSDDQSRTVGNGAPCESRRA
jgi:hypothetical protein